MSEKQTALNNEKNITYYAGVTDKEVNISGPWNNNTDPALNANNLNRIENALTEFLGKDGVIHDILTEDIPEINGRIADNLTSTTELINKVETEVSGNKARFEQFVSEDFASQTLAVESLNGNLASFKQEVSATYATNEMLTEVETNAGSAIASLTQTVTNGLESTTKLINEVKTEAATARAAIISQANTDRAQIELVTEQSNNNSSRVSTLELTATEHEAKFNLQAEYNDKNTESVAGINATVTQHAAKLEAQSKYNTENSEAVAGIQAKADANRAELDAVAAYSKDGVSGLAGFLAYASNTYAEASVVAKLESDTNTSIAQIKTTADDDRAVVQQLAQKTTETTDAISKSLKEVTDDYAKSTELTAYKTETTNAISNVTKELNDNYAKKSDITSFITESDVDGKITTAKNEVLTEATSTYAKKSDITSFITENAVDGKITTAKNEVLTEATSTYAKKSDITSFITENAVDGKITTAKNEAISYANDKCAKKSDLTSYATKDELGNVTESVAGKIFEATKDFAKSEMFAQIVDENGNIKSANIITAINGNKSEVLLSADKIALSGKKLDIRVDATNIEGTLSADQIDTSELTISADKINSGTYKRAINVNDKFIVDTSGNVQLNGNITWGTNASPTQVLYYKSGNTKPVDGKLWSEWPSTSTETWHKVFQSGSDYYASYTYDGGKTWSYAVQIVGQNGRDGTDGTNGKDGINGKDGTNGTNGVDGSTPYIKDGYWYINGVTTGVKAIGTNGKDGLNGTNGKDGLNGNTIQTVYAYYAKSGSSAPTTHPQNGSSELTDGWSTTPWSATPSKPFVFVSQCTVTNGIYGNWTPPTCWAVYSKDGVNGKDGSDATVTYTNVFNALTNNGTTHGCFTGVNSELYINAAYIKGGTIESELTLSGEVVAKDITAESGYIGSATDGWQIISEGLMQVGETEIGAYIVSGIPNNQIWSAYCKNTKLTPIGLKYTLELKKNGTTQDKADFSKISDLCDYLNVSTKDYSGNFIVYWSDIAKSTLPSVS